MNENPLVVPLREARDLSLAGGKAINLAKLLAADLPVPGGFVVTTEAFKFAGRKTSIPAKVEKLIREEYSRLGEPMVAARSSATAEDMAEASMAGQYETFLNLSSIDELLEAISGCWASLQSERLRSYLREQEIDPGTVGMAVVVQEMVPAESAGVLFTANPRTGARDEMLVEAAWGLGEGVVSGAVQPDRIQIRKEDGEVTRYEVSRKLTRLMPGGKGFEDVPRSIQERACLEYQHLRDLWHLGRRAVSHFDGEQDIEWAVADGKVYLLQSRAITTLRETAVRHSLPDRIRGGLRSLLDQERGPWVRHNLDETLQYPSPLSWSLVRHFMSGDGGFGKMHRMVGFEPAGSVASEGFLELIGGRIYMDCARMPEMFSEGYPFAYDVDLLRRDPDAAQQGPTVATGGMRELGGAAAAASKVNARLLDIAQTLDREFDESFVPEVKTWCEEMASKDLTSLDHDELAELWNTMQSRVFDDFGVRAFLPSMIEALATNNLLAFLEDFSWDEDPQSLLNRLVVSPIPDQTSVSNERLQDVGKDKVPISDWLDEFGFRGPGEFDLSNARWNERPEDLEEMAKRLGKEESLGALHERRKAEAGSAFDNFSEKLEESERERFKEVVELACRYVRFREDGKCNLIRAYATLRPVALEIGERLGIGSDVFLLESGEMLDALKSGFVPQGRIDERRVLRRLEKDLSLPRVIDRSDLDFLCEPVVDDGAPCREAHSLSGGVASGVARIVLAPEEAGELGDHYILVCPSTDPSWTPLFVGAKGLILECGGALSHGAIVARELGLPSVVLENATQLLKDGDELTIDANRGRVFSDGGEESGGHLEEVEEGVPFGQRPPQAGEFERAAGRRGVIAAIGWGIFLLAVWLFPAPWLKDPLFKILDLVLWPLVNSIGMPATVAAIAIFFAVIPLLLQKWFTDNKRLLVARDRAAALRCSMRTLPKESALRKQMDSLVAPVTMRVLKAAMTSLAFVLGPMMLIFLWLPARLDPASWNSEPGQVVSILAEVEGDWLDPMLLDVQGPLEIDSTGRAKRALPPIRETLETIRAEWSLESDTSDYPWELQASATQAHKMMLASLDRFLSQPLPTQKISWRIQVPESANGQHQVRLKTGIRPPTELTLAFGKNCPPAPTEITPGEGPIVSLKAIYPRALTKNVFWAPFDDENGNPWDFGWLGVYLLAYLPAMIVTKKLLRVA